jgi:hypothetical protein
MNASMPQQVDANTELVGVSGSGRTFVYNYRLSSADSASVDSQEFLNSIRPLITNHACTQPATRKAMLKRGVTLRYEWMDRNQKSIASLEVNEGMCGPDKQMTSTLIIVGILALLTPYLQRKGSGQQPEGSSRPNIG